MEKSEKSVKIGQVVYKVKAEDNRLEAIETHYPMPGYGNKTWTSAVLDLTHSKRYALVTADNGRNNWNGTGCEEVERRFIAKAEAKSIFDALVQRLQDAEDDTPDIQLVLEYARQQLVPELEATREELDSCKNLIR